MNRSADHGVELLLGGKLISLECSDAITVVEDNLQAVQRIPLQLELEMPQLFCSLHDKKERAPVLHINSYQLSS